MNVIGKNKIIKIINIINIIIMQLDGFPQNE